MAFYIFKRKAMRYWTFSFLAILFIYSCSTTKLTAYRYVDTFDPISSKSLVEVRSIIGGDTSYLINKKLIPNVIEDLNQATYDGIWNSVLWDKLQLVYKDSIVDYKSNGFVFAKHNSLIYYNLPTSIQHLWFPE